MRRRTAVLSLSAALSVVLVTGACSNDPEAPSAAEQSASASSAAAEIRPAATDDALGVTVTGEVNPTIAPQVQIATPLSVTETTRKVVAPGQGEEVASDSTVQFAYALYAGSTGELLDTSYGKTDARFELGQVTKGIARGLVGTHVGDRVAIAISPDDGFGDAVTQFGKEGVDATTTTVLVADVVRVVPDRATGTPVTPPANLPALTTGADGVPTGFDITDRTPPAQTVAQPLLQGTGQQVTAGQTISVQYIGARLEDGEVFDQSWDEGEPVEFTIGTGQVIAGWDQGLVGQAVGSRVLLVIPSAQAYGDEPQQGPAGPLVFAVDILDAY